jgi:hypothetical protein
MTFLFFTFTVSPCSTQNYWSVSNCCFNPISDSDVKVRSSAKSNNHMCKSSKVNASHSLSSKRPSKASKYNPNNKGMRGQPCFTSCYRWHPRLGGWCVQYPWPTLLASIAKSVPPPQGQPTPTTTLHIIQYQTIFLSPQSSNRVASFLPCFVFKYIQKWKSL